MLLSILRGGAGEPEYSVGGIQDVLPEMGFQIDALGSTSDWSVTSENEFDWFNLKPGLDIFSVSTVDYGLEIETVWRSVFDVSLAKIHLNLK